MWGNSTLQISLIIHINDTVPREYKRCDGVIVPPTTTLDSHRVGHKGYSGISLLFSLTANISVHTLSLMGQPLPPSIHTVSQSVHVLHTLNGGGSGPHTKTKCTLFFKYKLGTPTTCDIEKGEGGDMFGGNTCSVQCV